VIESSKALQEFEHDYQREAFSGLSFQDALGRFTSLWTYARELNPDFDSDWREDLEPDLEVARAVNGLPPRP
jgi:hypothetical protein